MDEDYEIRRGLAVGVITGFLGATVVTLWGGYEVGSAVNDSLHLTNVFARTAVNLATMGIVAGPAYVVGYYGGMIAGGLGATVSIGVRKTFQKDNNLTDKLLDE